MSWFRYLAPCQARCYSTIVSSSMVLGRVPAVGADPGRQRLTGEQLVYSDPGEPSHPQRQYRRDGALAGGDLLDRVPLVAQGLATFVT